MSAVEPVDHLEIGDRRVDRGPVGLAVARQVDDAPAPATLVEGGERLQRCRQRVVCAVRQEHDRLGGVRGVALAGEIEHGVLGATGGDEVEVRPRPAAGLLPTQLGEERGDRCGQPVEVLGVVER